MGKSKPKKRQRDAVSHDEVSGYAQTETLFKSNLFKLQTTELLREVTPPYGLPLAKLEAALRRLRAEMSALPGAELSWARGAAGATASHEHLTHLGLRGEAVRFAWAAPAKVDLVGSYLLRTAAAPELNVDMAVQLPTSTFLEKDYLDERYVDKRLLYLAHLGAELERATGVAAVRFAVLPHQSHHWPVLELTLRDPDGSSVGFDGWTVRVLPCVAADAFPAAKLRPQRCNLRGAGALPSAAYNNLVRLESGYSASLGLLHATFSRDTSGALREAAVLLKVWLRQRTARQSGSPTGFQLSLLLVHLLSTRAITLQMGAYHVLRIALKYLASTALATTPIVLPPAVKAAAAEPDEAATAEAVAAFAAFSPWVVTDAACVYNYGAGVTAGALTELSHWAALSLAALDSAQLDDAASFALLFTRAYAPSLRYDALFTVRLESAGAADAAGVLSLAASVPLSEAAGRVAEVEALLPRGFGARSRLVRAWHPRLEPWALLAPPPAQPASALHVGVWLDAGKAASLVDRGPSPAQEAETAAWLALWGPRSETRRFKDGAIVNAVVWECAPSARHTVLVQSARWLLQRHLGVPAGGVTSSLGGLDGALAAPGGWGLSHTSSVQVTLAFEKLTAAIRRLRDLPLSILSIQPTSASFSHSEEFAPS